VHISQDMGFKHTITLSQDMGFKPHDKLDSHTGSKNMCGSIAARVVFTHFFFTLICPWIRSRRRAEGMLNPHIRAPIPPWIGILVRWAKRIFLRQVDPGLNRLISRPRGCPHALIGLGRSGRHHGRREGTDDGPVCQKESWDGLCRGRSSPRQPPFFLFPLVWDPVCLEPVVVAVGSFSPGTNRPVCLEPIVDPTCSTSDLRWMAPAMYIPAMNL
jgi:hypothetical protein